MILAGEMPSFSASSLTVIPDGTLTGPVGDLDLASWARPAGAALAPLRRLAPGLGVDHDPALALGRGAALRPGRTAGLRRLLLGRRRCLRRRLAPHVLAVYRFGAAMSLVGPSFVGVVGLLNLPLRRRAGRAAFQSTGHRSRPGHRAPPTGPVRALLSGAKVHPASRPGGGRDHHSSPSRRPSAPTRPAAGAGRSLHTGASGLLTDDGRAPLLQRGQLPCAGTPQ